MIHLFLASLCYIAADPYFAPSMAFTVLCGLFIGSVIYDGELEDVKKALVALGSYSALILLTNMFRIIPQLPTATNATSPQFLASTATTLVVTFFYLLGMYLGVAITRYAHKGRK